METSVAIVTGASQGIGRATAIRLARDFSALVLVARGLANLMLNGPAELNNTYAIALQTMAFAAADPEGFKPQIGQNVAWLEQAQLRGMGGGPPARPRSDWARSSLFSSISRASSRSTSSRKASTSSSS